MRRNLFFPSPFFFGDLFSEYKVHSYNRNGLCAVAFMDDHYPVRSAFSLLNKVNQNSCHVYLYGFNSFIHYSVTITSLHLKYCKFNVAMLMVIMIKFTQLENS